MNVLENSDNHIDKITFMIDDEKLRILDNLNDNLNNKLDIIMYELDDMTGISVNIYDNIGIVDRITKYKNIN